MVRIVIMKKSNNSKNGSNNRDSKNNVITKIQIIVGMVVRIVTIIVKIRIAILAHPQECSGMLTSLAETRKRFLHSLLGIGLYLSGSQKKISKMA